MMTEPAPRHRDALAGSSLLSMGCSQNSPPGVPPQPINYGPGKLAYTPSQVTGPSFTSPIYARSFPMTEPRARCSVVSPKSSTRPSIPFTVLNSLNTVKNIPISHSPPTLFRECVFLGLSNDLKMICQLQDAKPRSGSDPPC